MAIELALTVALLCLASCAAQKPVQVRPSTFWHGCAETLPAAPDGFQHFTCTDLENKQWEVLVKSQPKGKK